MVYCLCGTDEIKLQIWGNNRTYLRKMEYCFLRAKLKRERDIFFFFFTQQNEIKKLFMKQLYVLAVHPFLYVDFFLHLLKNSCS